MVNFSSKYLSKKGFEDLEKELEHLTKVKRREISGRIEEAISLGDISENAEYQEAKDAQMFNEQRIAELEDLLSRATLLPKNDKKSFTVEVGCSVVLKKGKDKNSLEYQIVGSSEADPMNRRISNESPLGIALLGRKKGETIKVLTPGGEMEYTIVNVSN